MFSTETRKAYVDQIPFDVSPEELASHLKPAGAIENVIYVNNAMGKFTGKAQVVFKSH